MKISPYRNVIRFLHFPAPLLVLLLFMASCSLTRDVPEGEVLLNRVNIKVKDDKLHSDLSSLVKQKENRKILWIYRFRLRFYSSFLFKKNSKWKPRTSIGEPPVLFDSSLAASSAAQMHAFLKNKGYFDNQVTFETHTHKRKKKLEVDYNVYLGTPTLIAGLNYDIPDTNVLVAIASSQPQTLIKIGDNLDIDVLEQERKRIAKFLQNRGFFYFSDDLVTFFADTMRIKKKAIILTKVKPNPVKYVNDSIKVKPYEQYTVEDVFVRQDFDETKTAIIENDTLDDSGYKYLNRSVFTVRPKVLSRSIFLSPGHFYKLEDHENTFRRLSSLNNYKYISISYLKDPDSDTNNLDCIISLSPSVPMSVGLEFNATTTGGNPGINGAVSFQHRNTFKGAEILRLRVLAGLEAQNVRVNDGKVVENTPFNTIEFGPELSLTLPKFLFPIDHSRFPKRVIPRTTMTVSYNYQQRPDYTRSLINANLGYNWRESKTKTHTIQPWNVSQIKIDKTTAFQERLDSINNPSLTASYEDNFITSIIYNFVYNDKLFSENGKSHVFRGNLELAGNMVYFFDKNIFHTPPDENGQYHINGIPYAQFARAYVEYIHNVHLRKSIDAATRTFFGIGIPYGNSSVVPFVRRFYGGGTNGIRAWRSRGLGPGSTPNDTLALYNIDQTGDIKIEQNLEYRFGIFRFIEGALFTDMGNIWVLEKNGYSDAAHFQFNKLWKDMAIGMGVGMRLNFSFFVIRLDVAKRVKDPGAADPYALRFFYPNPATFNFAIGYPF